MRAPEVKRNPVDSMRALVVRAQIAIVGGRAEKRPFEGLSVDCECYGSPNDVGAGELRRLEKALKKGRFALVVILTRWGSHAATKHVRRICKAHGTPVLIWTGGLSSLASHLARVAF